MSYLINYIYDYWNTPEVVNLKENNSYHINENVEDDCYLIDKKFLITKELLEEINLKPPDNIIPNPSRNMPPMDKVNLADLNKAQLNMILNVKLKPTQVNEKPTYYEPKHPVLRELLNKFSFKNNAF